MLASVFVHIDVIYLFHNNKPWSWNCSTQMPLACVLIIFCYTPPAHAITRVEQLIKNSCHWLDPAYFHNLCLYCGKKQLRKWSEYQSHSVEVFLPLRTCLYSVVINWGRKQKQSLGLSNCWGPHFLNFILAFQSTVLVRQFAWANNQVYLSNWDLGLGKYLQGWPEKQKWKTEKVLNNGAKNSVPRRHSDEKIHNIFKIVRLFVSLLWCVSAFKKQNKTNDKKLKVKYT